MSKKRSFAVCLVNLGRKDAKNYKTTLKLRYHILKIKHLPMVNLAK